MTDLLRTAGFVDVRESNVTPAFERTTRAYLERSHDLHDKLRAEWGDESLARSQTPLAQDRSP